MGEPLCFVRKTARERLESWEKVNWKSREVLNVKYRYIPALVMLAAGLVCCILSVVQGWPVQYSLITLLIVLIVFYIIGQIAAQIVGRVQAEHLAMVEAERKRREAEEQARREQEEREAMEAEEAEKQEVPEAEEANRNG